MHLRRLLCLLTALTILAGITPFTRAHAEARRFSDVYESQYFYTAVSSMYEKGIVSGCGDGTFLPQNPVRHSEAIKLVCALAGVGYSGYTGVSSPWYTDVMTWAEDMGIVADGTDPDAYATREEICGYIVLVYKMDTSTKSDVFSDTDSAAANALYDRGVISGIKNSDGTLSFDGAANVKRCDVCVMLSRLSESAEKPDWSYSMLLDRSHYSISRLTEFKTFDDFADEWRYMMVNAVFSDCFQVNGSYTEDEINELYAEVKEAYEVAEFDYLEYGSFMTRWSIECKGIPTGDNKYLNPVFFLKLSSGEGLTNGEVGSEIHDFNVKCSQIVTELYTDGELKTGMTDKEKAFVLFKYVTANTTYDTDLKSFSGYDAAVHGTAVCQGYAAMYNRLCNLAGVRMEGMTGESGGSGHAWSRMEYNGTYYNVDCTWGDDDKKNTYDDTFFWVTDKFLKSYITPRTFDCESLVYGEWD